MTLDRAFIKAFTDKPQSPVAPRTSAARPRAAPPLSAFVDMQSDGTEDMFLPLEEVARDARPLSSFAARPKIHDSCRAMLEIDRAIWPTSASDLMARAAQPFAGFADQIIERASAGQKCVAVASHERGDGRTTVSLALAHLVASRGQRVAVVDADLENPLLAKSCGVAVQTGWDDLVASELALGEALISVVEEGVTLLPWRAGAASLAEMAGSLRAAGIFGTLREHYDLVLLDAPPLMGRTTVADFAAFGAAIHLDALYLIHNVRTMPREELIAACAKLRRAGVPLSGLIENFVSPGGCDEQPGAGSASSAGRRLVVHS